METIHIYVSSLLDAASYYESLLGFSKNAAVDSTDHLLLTSDHEANLGVSLKLVQNAQGEHLQQYDKSRQTPWRTHQFWVDYQTISSLGVVFEHEPIEENGNIYTSFIDAYGFHWRLITQGEAL